MAVWQTASTIRKGNQMSTARAVIVSNIISIDGYYEGPGGNVMALNMDPSFDAYNLERIRQAGTVLLVNGDVLGA